MGRGNKIGMPLKYRPLHLICSTFQESVRIEETSNGAFLLSQVSTSQPQTSAIFPLSPLVIFFLGINEVIFSLTIVSLAFCSSRDSNAPMKSPGVFHLRCISSAFSPVTPLVHISIFKKTSLRVIASDLPHIAENAEKVRK